MKVSLTDYRSASADEIANAEAQLGTVFPKAYREFLSRYDGATVEDSTFAGDLAICIRSFIPVSKLASKASSIEGLTSGVWPIAEDSNGNFSYIRKDDFSVWFWDHEVESGDKCLAESFDEFIERLQPLDPNATPLPPHRVVSGWVDPSFRPEF